MTPTARSQISAALKRPTAYPTGKPQGEVCAAGGKGAFIRGKPPGFRQKAKEVVKIPEVSSVASPWQTCLHAVIIHASAKAKAVDILTEKISVHQKEKTGFEFNFKTDFTAHCQRSKVAQVKLMNNG